MTEKKTTKEIKENVVNLPEGVTCKVLNDKLVFEKAGVVQEVTYNHVYVTIIAEGNNLNIKPNSKKKLFISVSNTIKKIINNTLEGFERDYVCKMQIVYKHFPITVKIEDNKFKIINFYGEKKVREVNIAPKVKIDINGKELTLSGINKQAVGQTAGSIESKTRLKGKDYRVFDDGIYIVEKVK